LKIRVYYEDTDAGGIVYHTNYIKYCERARSEIFFQNNYMPSDGEKNGFVVKDIKADFISTASLGDLLEVETKILSIKNTSLVLLQEVYKDAKKIFSMEICLVYVDIKRAKPTRIPLLFRELFLSLD